MPVAAAVITISKDNSANFGPIPSVSGTIKIGASAGDTYPVGGFVLAASKFGLKSPLAGVDFFGVPTAMITDGFSPLWDSTTGAIKIIGALASVSYVVNGPYYKELADTTALTTAPYVLQFQAYALR